MTLITSSVQAYVNYGRWVADCGRKFCANAMALQPGQQVFVCGGAEGCGFSASIIWPPDANEIWNVLQERPVKSTRNWIPIGHPYADAGYPAGQTPAQLREEQKEMESLGG